MARWLLYISVAVLFLSLIAAEPVRNKRSLNYANKDDENDGESAEYNYLNLLLGIISRGIQQYRDLSHRFDELVLSHSNQNYFKAARTIPWFQLNNRWNGVRDGYDRALRELPRLLEDALPHVHDLTLGELGTLNHYGVMALAVRQQRDREGNTDQGHAGVTQALEDNLNRVRGIILPTLEQTDDHSDNTELRRRGIYSRKEDRSFHVEFSTDVDFEGRGKSYQIKTDHFRECYNFDSILKNQVSSVNTGGGCIILFSKENCIGAALVLAPGSWYHNNLVKRGFNDAAESFRAC